MSTSTPWYCKLPLQPLGLLRPAGFAKPRARAEPQRARLDRLFEKPERAQIVHGLNGRLDIAEGRQHDGGRHVPCDASRFNSSKPSMRGIIRSVTMTLAENAASFSRASCPSPATSAL